MAASAPLEFNMVDSCGYLLEKGYTSGVRLNLQSFLWKEALGFDIHPSIPVPKNDCRIADIGSGTAIWLLSVGRQHSSAQLCGVDIDITQAPPRQWLPSNIAFRSWNMYNEIPEDMLGKFDLVHCRLLVLAVKNSDPKPILETLQKLLKPGGYLQWDELNYIDLSIKTATESLAVPGLQEFQDFVYSQGKNNWTVQLADVAKDIGFEDALSYHFGGSIEFAKAEMENILQTVDEFASRLMSLGREETALKVRKILAGAYQESLEGAVLSIPRVVCVARKRSSTSLYKLQEPTTVPSAPYYIAEIGPRLKPAIEDLFKSWSGLAGDVLKKHLHTIRDRAWAHAPYPCIGEWMFLLPSISAFPSYRYIVGQACKNATILDLACCFGQDLRLLASQGVSTKNMYASDIKAELWELGFELFQDRDRMDAQFIQADIFDPHSNLRQLDGEVDVILACQFLHLFNWEQQVTAIERIIGFSRLGTLVVGYQRAREKSLEVSKPWGDMFIHDMDSFNKIWRYAEEKTGTRWDINASLVDLRLWGMEAEDTNWMDPDPKGVNFVIRRLK